MELTPEQWRDQLLKDLQARLPAIRTAYRYYRGDHPLPWAPDEIRNDYAALLRMCRSNWCRLVVKATSERLRVVGLKFSDDSNDTAAWKRYWQGNRLDAESRMVHDCALIARRGFTLVWPREGMAPSITPEHPSQVIVAYGAGDRRMREAGLKAFADVRRKKLHATLWTPDAVYNWVAPLGASGTHGSFDYWTDEAKGIFPEAENPMGEVPLVEFVADPDLIDEPMGELDGGVTDIQDRINKTILDRLVTSNLGSVKQKWATGLEVPKDPETGQEIEPFKNAVNRMFYNENPDAKFGTFDSSDLQQYISAAESDIQHLAAVTRTPPHYLLGQSGAFPSGQSLKATETGLVAKVLERTDSFTESWEDTTRLAIKADPNPIGDPNDLAMSMVWKDPESHSIAEMHDAAVKMVAIGMPWRERMAFLGYTPTEIENLEGQRSDELADQALAAAPAPAAA